MQVAIIGSGTSGRSATWPLKDRISYTLFEKNNYLGSHTNTIDPEWQGKTNDCQNLLRKI